MVYRTIVADPPWEYDDGFAFKDGDKFKHQILPYPSMEIEEILVLPVRAMADPKGCALFLWTTNRFLEESFDVLRAWGFKYRQTVVWRKTNPQPVGGSVAPNAEFLLVARRGPHTWHGPRWPDSVISAPRTTHSAKPEVFMDLVESISPPPRISRCSVVALALAGTRGETKRSDTWRWRRESVTRSPARFRVARPGAIAASQSCGGSVIRGSRFGGRWRSTMEETMTTKNWTKEQAADAYKYGICVNCRGPRFPLLRELLLPEEWAKIPADAHLTLICSGCRMQYTTWKPMEWTDEQFAEAERTNVCPECGAESETLREETKYPSLDGIRWQYHFRTITVVCLNGHYQTKTL